MLKLNVVPKSQSPAVPEIRMDQTPHGVPWALVPLYRSTVDCDLLTWQVSYRGGQFVVVSNEIAEGTFETTNIQIPQNMDACVFARSLAKEKFSHGYRLPGGDVTPLRIMKADKYNPESFWANHNNNNRHVYTQAKLHGIRMLTRLTETNTIIKYSALANTFVNLKHLDQELTEFAAYLPRNFTLDGELYNHEMDFSTLTSAVRTVNVLHPRAKDVKYWIFDIDYNDHENSTPFEARYKLLAGAFRNYVQDRSKTHDVNDPDAYPKHLVMVQCSLARCHDDVETQHTAYVANGYEGIMIRKISGGTHFNTQQHKSSLYRDKRCTNILKYKHFDDKEVTINDIVNIEGLNYFAVTDSNSRSFYVRTNDRIPVSNKLLVIGKPLTIRFIHTDATGVPVHPRAVAIRDYE